MRITDPKAMRALAHPLRLDLIELLGALGEATAAECARHLDATQANCSFHLRQLAKYGFVEPAAARGDARERAWRLTDVEQTWSSADAGPAAAELERVFVRREADRVVAWEARAATEPDEWRRAAFVGGATVPLTAAELAGLRAGIEALLAPYVARLDGSAARPRGARFVRVFRAGVPLGHLDGAADVGAGPDHPAGEAS